MNKPVRPILDEAQAAFIAGPVSINVASCSSERVPSVVRAHGCRVSDDLSHVTVFVSTRRAEAVLRDVRAGGAIAVVFSLPHTHETLQLKGTNASIVPLEAGDAQLIKQYAEGFINEVRGLGHTLSLAGAVMSSVNEDSLGLLFAPSAAFLQTPGPRAGQRLEPKP